MSAAVGIRRPSRVQSNSILTPVTVIAALIAAWIVVAFALQGRNVVPYPWSIIAAIVSDWPMLSGNLGYTLVGAAAGLVSGVAVVIPLAIICLLAPILEPVVIRVAVVVHVIPIVAIAPILLTVLPDRGTQIVVSALTVYFPLLIPVLLGLRSTDERINDVIVTNGGGRWALLRRLRIPSAIPNFASGLQIAVPSAILGALLGEFFGSENGLGAVLVSAQEQLLTTRAWAVAVLIGVVAACGYGVVALLTRTLAPWAGSGATVGTNVAGSEENTLTRSQSLISAAISVVVLFAFWVSLRPVFGMHPFFTKSPSDVIRFLLHGNPATNVGPGVFAHAFSRALGQTLVDAGLGFVVGTVLSVLVAVLFVSFPAISRALMPFAIMLRSVPLIALAPLLTLIFGRGLLGVTVLVVLVTFFPTLVTVMTGLRAAPSGAAEVVLASGGSPAAAAWRVRMFYAIPAISASARVSIPGAITGATLAEWLATGKGVGNLLTLASVQADYFTLWAGGILIVVVALIAYGLVGLADRAVSRRLGIRL